MSDKKIIILMAFSTIILLFGGVFFLTKNTATPEIKASQNAKAISKESSFDWGEIGLKDGNVEKTFEIKNDGTENLKLFGVTTSCMCTTAQLILDDKSSPKFGMHDKSSYVMEVPPGKTAKLKVVFDPAFHGPSGIGPINRQITVATNDPDNSEQKYMLTAVVRN